MQQARLSDHQSMISSEKAKGTRLHPQKESGHFCRSGCGCPPQLASHIWLQARKELGWVSLKPGLSLGRVFKIMFRGLYWYIYIYIHRQLINHSAGLGYPHFGKSNAEPPGSNEGSVRRRDNIFGVEHRISPGFNSWTGGCNWDTLVFIYIYILYIYIYITIYIYMRERERICMHIYIW